MGRRHQVHTVKYLGKIAPAWCFPRKVPSLHPQREMRVNIALLFICCETQDCQTLLPLFTSQLAREIITSSTLVF